MANLKELRSKISVIQSTRKVTSAMKLVAGVKLRKSEKKTILSREYTAALNKTLSCINRASLDLENELLDGRSVVSREMLLIFASDRGLCGNYNYIIQKQVSEIITSIHQEEKKLHLICIGCKPYEAFKNLLLKDDIIELVPDFYKNDVMLQNAHMLAEKIVNEFSIRKVDKISVIYTHYHSIIKREVLLKCLIPMHVEQNDDKTTTIFEPHIDDVLKKIIPYNIAMQIYQSALESLASEQSARMTSMDNATKNADDLLANLTIKYNRVRQYGITQELVEIVSGANAIEKG